MARTGTAGKTILRDHRGELVDLARLTEREGGATVTGVRQAAPEHPSWGLSPEGLGAILRDSEGSDPSRYYALLADVQEREWHYRGVLFQRRAALAQLPVTVDPYSDDAAHVDHADFIRRIVTLPDFTHARFELGDALDKGMAFGALVWETSERQWMPRSIRLGNPTWFRYDALDLETPQLVDDEGRAQPLAPYKWIVHRARLNSGIPIRDGLGRAAVWAWMFKNYDIKSWMIFLDRYGLPIRLGKYPAGASPSERRTLLAALRSIGRDAAAMVPEGMSIEFVKADGGAGGGSAFRDQATYFDEQLSKLVLGQTGTTDASKGGYAVGRVHEGVRDAIASYDGLMLAMTLNRDLVRPAIDLNHGPQAGYPQIRIGLGDQRNVELVMKHLGDMIDRGLPVEASQIYPMFGLTEPADPAAGSNVVLLQPGGKRMATLSVRDEATRDVRAGGDGIDALADEMAGDMALLGDLRTRIEEAIDLSTSYEELLARLDGMASDPAGQRLVEKMAFALFNARLAGELGAPVARTD